MGISVSDPSLDNTKVRRNVWPSLRWEGDSYCPLNVQLSRSHQCPR